MIIIRNAVFFLCVTVIPYISAADTTFKVKAISPPIPFEGIRFIDVSSNGEITGVVETGSIEGGNFQTAPFVTAKSKVKLLRTPPSVRTDYVPNRINDAGTVVGFRIDTDQAVIWSDKSKLPRLVVPSSLRSKVAVIDGEDLRFSGSSNSLTNSGILVGSYYEGTLDSKTMKGFIFDSAQKKFTTSPRIFLGLSDNAIALERQNPVDQFSFGIITDFQGKKERRRRVKGAPQILNIAQDGRLFGSIPTGAGGTRCAIWTKATGGPTALVPSSKPGGFCYVTALAGNHAIARYDSDLDLEGDFSHLLYIDIKKNEATIFPSTVTDSLGRTYTDIRPGKVLENGSIYANGLLNGLKRILVLTPRS